ncbi:MAG: ATP-grasp domain-containing protein [Patescibacteria group bacterium]|nr:ATP-grasp domain-containing protein [Patescibacteria group bacterium]
MQKLLNKNIIYVTRDIERATGFDLSNPNYYIISNSCDFAKQIAKDKNNILLIEAEKQIDTWELLEKSESKNFINKIIDPQILVFKPTTQIEKICAENNWKLLNPSATLANKVEQKISSVNWLAEDSKYFPDVQIDICENIKFNDKKFILQFNQSHTGSGTMLIESKKQLDEIKNKFPKRDCKTSRFVEGILLTNNNVVTDKETMLGNINYQITGLEPFTKNKFATIGNDWGLAHKLLNENLLKQYQEIVEAIGKRLRRENWRGLFGVDIIWETKTNKLYLIEINARQPANTTFESQLQMQNKKSENEITTFEAHLLALLGESLENKKLIAITDGAQIILRKSQENIDTENIKSKLEKENFIVIKYDNDKENSDLLRIQSNSSIMKEHEKFNENGTKIVRGMRNEEPSQTAGKQGMVSKMIEHYLNLKVGNTTITCPYFNNRRSQIRGALAVLIGKGSPESIEEELQIISLKEKIDLGNLPAEKIKEFLVNNNLGVDCSGFVYHILDALTQDKKNKKLKQIIHFPLAKSVVRKMIAKLRPAENCGVTTLAHEINSKKINLKEVEANDFIIFLGSGPKQDYNHIMFVESVTDKTINYIHAYKWPSDGQYNHGVRRGQIEIIDENKNILEQKWLEQEKTAENNWTWLQAKSANEIFVGRLKNL